MLIWPFLVSQRPWPLTSKSNQFVFVPGCSEVVNLVKFQQAVYKMCWQTFSIWSVDHTHRQHVGQPTNRMPPAAANRWHRHKNTAVLCSLLTEKLLDPWTRSDHQSALFRHVRCLPSSPPAHNALQVAVPRQELKQKPVWPRHTWLRQVTADCHLATFKRMVWVVWWSI